MSNSAEAVAGAFVRAINRQDADALADLMAEQHRFVDSLGQAVVGREKMRAGWKGYFSLVPDYTITVDETFCDGTIVVLLGTAQGTYAAGGNLKPENRWKTPVALRASVEGDRISEWQVYADNEPMRKLMAKADREE